MSLYDKTLKMYALRYNIILYTIEFSFTRLSLCKSFKIYLNLLNYILKANNFSCFSENV